MPTFTIDTPTRAVTLGGIVIKAPESFAAGDTLDAPTARFLNGAVISAVGKNLMNEVKKELEATNKDRPKKDQLTLEDFVDQIDLQAAFEAKFADYTPGAISRGGTKESADPVEARMQMLALAAVKARIIAKGGKVHTFMTTRDESGKTKLAALTDAYVERFADDLRAQAEAQIAAESARDDFDIGDVGEDTTGAESQTAA